MLLSGKNTIITGCLTGIGKSTLELFAKNGSNVWACAIKQDIEFEQFCKQLSLENDVWIKPVYFDLADMEQVRAAMRQIAAEKLPVHVLVNLAGMTKDALFHMMSLEQMKVVFEINFFSQMYITQFITKMMIKNKSGSVINTSSISGIDGNYGQLSYSASKAAIISATKTLSIELASQGIRVNAIAPGVINTDMIKSVPDDILQKQINKMKIKRIGTPMEVAGAILFFASDLSQYITGQVLRIDGGIK